VETGAILALDQGTTGSTALVIARDGRVVGSGYSEFTQYFPKPGWVEHDAAEIRDVTIRVARDALASAGVVPSEPTGASDSTHAPAPGEKIRVEGIGITNQRETVVLWDRETGEPVHPAIVWQDRRTTEVCRWLREAGHEAEVRRRTGLVLDPYFSGTKIRWILESRPDLRARAEQGELAFGTVDSWLVYVLTGGKVHATDPTNASRTLLFDLEAGEWGGELLALLDVPRELLPEIRPSSSDFGTAEGSILGVDAPIGGVAGDQQAALFGQGCWGPGLAKNTYGTGAFLLLHTGDQIARSEHGLLTTVACDAKGGRSFALEGSIFVAGAAIQWLRDGLGILESASESEAMARSLDGNDGVYFVPSFVGLGAPHWDPEARGAILGLTRGTTRAHLVRAALEAMAYGTAEVLQAMEADSGIRTRELRVDGGAATNDWFMTFQAGILGVPVRRPALVQTTALGAAGLAGLQVGLWETADAFLSAQADARIFRPEMGKKEQSSLLAGWRRAIDVTRAFGS
jgi:glycerol kinase